MKIRALKFSLIVAVMAIVASCQEGSKNQGTKQTDTLQAQVDTMAQAVKPDTIAKPDTTVTAETDTATLMRRYEQEGTSKQHAGENNPGRKVVYLTFDDGPSNNTPKILDILKQNGVHATFFVIGHDKHSLDLITREHEEGHAIGAHSFTHNYNIYTSLETYFDDLEKIEQVIEEKTGSRTSIIRFPGGSSNTVFYKYSHDPLFMVRLTQAVKDRGYQYVDWNLSSSDASAAKVPTSTIISQACRAKGDDICLLMHDTYGKTTTVEALPSIIKFFQEKGYEFGTLTDKSYVCHHGIRPYGSKGGKSRSKKDTSAKQKQESTPDVKQEPNHEQAPQPATTPAHESQTEPATTASL